MIGHRNRIRQVVGSALGFGLLLSTSLPAPAGAADLAPSFLRGDANGDGRVSLADALLIKRWFLEVNEFGIIPTDIVIPCMDAADSNDDGWVDEGDSVAIGCELFFGGTCLPFGPIRPPFPQVGPDTTADYPGEESTLGNDLGCATYDPHPQEATSDLIRIGEFNASPGQVVGIPVYLTNSQKVEAIQLVISYDPQVLSPIPDSVGGCRTNFDFQGSILDQMFDKEQYPSPCGALGMVVTRWYPDQGFFTVGIINSFQNPADMPFHYDPRIPEGEDQLLFRILAVVSEGATPGTTMSLDLTNGPDEQGVRPPYYIRNELTYEGDGRFVSQLPQRIGGRIAIVDDIIFFIRGDANRDGVVDISDPISVINFLFLGGNAPACQDAADADDNGVLEITDVVVTLGQLFSGTGTIAQPYPQVGKDPTADALDCKF